MNDKIVSGGLYLVNLNIPVNPEFGFYHYCVILKTQDKDLFIALPTTSKNKQDEFKFIIPEDNSICLFKHMRSISRIRIIKPLYINDKKVVLSSDSLSKLLYSYLNYINIMCRKTLYSNADYIKQENIKNKIEKF